MQSILASNYQADIRLQTRGRKMSHISGNVFTIAISLQQQDVASMTISQLLKHNVRNLCILKFTVFKCHCNGKIIDLILIATEQHFRTKLNGAFSFSISCLVSEIFSFLEHAN